MITNIVNKKSKATIKQVSPVPSPGPLRTSAAPSSQVPSTPSSQVPSTPGQPRIPVDFEDKPWFGDQAYIKNNHSSGIAQDPSSIEIVLAQQKVIDDYPFQQN